MAIQDKLNKAREDRFLRTELKEYRRYKSEKISRNIRVYTKDEHLPEEALRTIRFICRTEREIHFFFLLGTRSVYLPNAQYLNADEYYYALAEMELIAKGDRSFEIFRIPKYLGIHIDGVVSCIRSVRDLLTDEEGRILYVESLEAMNDEVALDCQTGEILAIVLIDR